MMTTTERGHAMDEQVRVAAKWWADQLRDGTKQDAGDVMVNAMVGAFGVKPDLTLEQIDVFEAALVEGLPAHLAKTWNDDNPKFGTAVRSSGCDYGPDAVIRDAAEKADIPADCPPLPMKTVMWIDPDEVRVSHGYAAPDQVLWTPE